jgi:mannitol-specific phosphotransferase system IIBC component
MSDQSFTAGTKMGTAGGTLMIILANITTGDVLKTVVLAALGAVVSFGVSLLLKRMMKWQSPPKST